MVLRAHAEIRVPFHDIDILHVAWHGHYAKYFEIARTALMQKLNLDWPRLRDIGIAMPVVELHVNYRQPLRYDDLVVAEAMIHETRYPELKIEYELRSARLDRILATGWTRQIYYSVAEEQALFTVPDVIALCFPEDEP
jgi:acyl-CoA thioester hydrolase